MSVDQLKRIIRLKIELASSEAAFLGTFGFSMPTIERADLPTMAVSSKAMYFNREWVASLKDEELKAVIVHELMHVALKHTLKERVGNRNPVVANYAMDFVINAIISKYPFYGTLPEKVLLSSKFDESWSFEMVYDYIMAHPGELKVFGSIGTIDDHSTFAEDQDNESPVGDKTIEDRLRSAAATAGRDKVPALFSQYINAACGTSAYDWKKVLRNSMPKPIRGDKSYSKANRRRSGGAFLHAGRRKDEEYTVCIAVDTSGSVSDEMLAEFLREIYAIVKSVTKIKIRIWCFDTGIYNEQVFDTQSIATMAKYQFQGSGGTMFEVNWEYMKTFPKKPDVLILFTDGYPCGTWGSPNYCTTIFAICGQGNRPKPTFGLPIYIN